MRACMKRNMKGLTPGVQPPPYAVGCDEQLDPKAKRERPDLKKGAAHEKALRHGSGAALQ